MTIQLPTPLSRADCYLATAAGMTGVTLPEEPLSREEEYLAKIAGDESIITPAPLSLKERWLAVIAGDTSVTAPEVEGAFLIGQQMVRAPFLANCAGIDGVVLPTDPNRTETYFIGIAENQHHAVLKTARGVNIVLTDVVSGIESLDYIYGNTTQETTTGKNLYNATKAETTTNTLVWSADTSEISLNGKVTSAANLNLPNVSLKAGTYVCSLEVVSGTITSTSTGLNTYFGGTNISRTPSAINLTNVSPRNTFVITVSTDTTDAHLFFYARTSETFSDVKVKYQIVAGSTADYNFEPYTNGPAPNPDYPETVNVVTGEQTVIASGSKNLFDYNSANMQNVGFVSSDGGVGGANANRLTSVNATKLLKGTYTLSYTGVNSCWILAYDLNGNYLGNGYIQSSWSNGQSKTFTVNQDCQVRLSFRYSGGGSVAVKDYDIQIETGSTATSYVPFNGVDFYTIDLGATELCKIGTYQDKIYKSGGDWYVKKECGKTTDTVGSASKTISGMVSGGDIYSYCGGTVNGTTVTYASALTVANTIYYPLATPTDTKITDATLISQLEAVNNATLPKPNAFITVSPTGTNLPGELEISYYGEAE